MDDPVAGLAGEVPQQGFARPPTSAGEFVFSVAQHQYLPAGRRVGGLKGTPTENEAEAGLADPRVSHQHHFRINIMDRPGRRGTLPLAQKNIEVEFIQRKARAGDGEARKRWMKGQTPKAVTRMPLDYSDHVPSFGTPDSYRVIPAHSRE